VPKTPKSGAELERNQVPLSAEITCRFQPKSGAGLLRFLHLKNEGIDGLIAALNRKADILTGTTARSF
jgi:hypothetical protein